MRVFNLTNFITGTAIALSIMIAIPVEAQSNKRGATRTEQNNYSSRNNQGSRC